MARQVCSMGHRDDEWAGGRRQKLGHIDGRQAEGWGGRMLGGNALGDGGRVEERGNGLLERRLMARRTLSCEVTHTTAASSSSIRIQLVCSKEVRLACSSAVHHDGCGHQHGTIVR
jgi:hypothetical protein